MKSTLYLFLLVTFSFFIFIVVNTFFKSQNPATDFLLCVIAVHLVMGKIEKYYKEAINNSNPIDS